MNTKNYKPLQLKEGYGIKNKNYVVIWSQSKLSIKSKKFFDKSEDIEEKVKIM